MFGLCWSDLAEAHVRALARLERSEGMDAFNLGTSQGANLLVVLAAVELVAGKPGPCSIGARREGDPTELVSDLSKAMREFAWKPAHSDLATIVGTAWAWHKRTSSEEGV